MAEELAATGRPADAAALYADYVGDAEAAVAHLLQAHAWREALRTAYRCFAAGWVGSCRLPCCCASALLAVCCEAESLECECDGRCFEQLTTLSARHLHDWWRAELITGCSKQLTHMPLARIIAHLTHGIGFHSLHLSQGLLPGRGLVADSHHPGVHMCAFTTPACMFPSQVCARRSGGCRRRAGRSQRCGGAGGGHGGRHRAHRQVPGALQGRAGQACRHAGDAATVDMHFAVSAGQNRTSRPAWTSCCHMWSSVPNDVSRRQIVVEF